MLAVAAGLVLYLSHNNVLPPLPSAVVIATWIVMFVCGALAAAAIGGTIQGWIGHAWVALRRWWATRLAGRRFRQYVPYLSNQERQILGYLLINKQKTFVADHDAGHAATLLARGYIQFIGAEGQPFARERYPFAVPEYVWKVMEEMSDQFPHRPVFADGRAREVEPWRIHWMAQ